MVPGIDRNLYRSIHISVPAFALISFFSTNASLCVDFALCLKVRGSRLRRPTLGLHLPWVAVPLVAYGRQVLCLAAAAASLRCPQRQGDASTHRHHLLHLLLLLGRFAKVHPVHLASIANISCSCSRAACLWQLVAATKVSNHTIDYWKKNSNKKIFNKPIINSSILI